jgi:molybdenum cofactor cytidylyltransferase
MTAIILAAGFSRRFGKEKLLMNIKGKPIILHVIDLVLSMGFKETVLVFQNAEIGELAAGTNIKCIHNFDAAEGISASIKYGIRNSEPTDAYIFFTGDQPFIEAATVNRLLEAFYKGKGSIIVPKYAGINGNPVIFASEWKAQLEGLSGDVGGKIVIKGNPDKVYFVDIPDQKEGMDIDTREDYVRHEGRIV